MRTCCNRGASWGETGLQYAFQPLFCAENPRWHTRCKEACGPLPYERHRHPANHIASETHMKSILSAIAGATALTVLAASAQAEDTYTVNVMLASD